MAMTKAPTTTTEDDITNETLRRFEGTPDPRLREIMLSLTRHLHGFIKDVQLTEARVVRGDQVPDRHRAQVRRHPAGVHPAVGHDGRVDGRRPDQPPEAGRRHRVHGVRSVPPPRRAGAADGRPHRAATTPNGDAAASVRPRARHRGQPDRRRAARRLAGELRGLLRLAARRTPRSCTCAASSAPARTARYWFRTTRPVHYPIPTDGPVGRDAARRPTAIRTARRTSTSWCRRTATSR